MYSQITEKKDLGLFRRLQSTHYVDLQFSEMRVTFSLISMSRIFKTESF